VVVKVHREVPTGESMVAAKVVWETRGDKRYIRDEKVLDDDAIDCVDAMCDVV
jgi:hypothetical protein